MSEQSYQENLARGVTGPDTNTCHPAAFDRISLRTGISTHTYETYDRLWTQYSQTGPEEYFGSPLETQFTDVYHQIDKDLGVYGTKLAISECIVSCRSLGRRLTDLSGRGYRTVVFLEDFGESHAIGLLDNGDGTYETRSTIELFAEQAVTAEVLFRAMRQTSQLRPRSHVLGRPRVQNNLVAIPPDPK
jgi:hypothetical protein